MISYKCEKCGAALESPNSMVGRKDKCPLCGATGVVPRPPKRSPLIWAVCGFALLAVIAVVLVLWLGQAPGGGAKDGSQSEKIAKVDPPPTNPATPPPSIATEPASPTPSTAEAAPTQKSNQDTTSVPYKTVCGDIEAHIGKRVRWIGKHVSSFTNRDEDGNVTEHYVFLIRVDGQLFADNPMLVIGAENLRRTAAAQKLDNTRNDAGYRVVTGTISSVGSVDSADPNGGGTPKKAPVLTDVLLDAETVVGAATSSPAGTR